MPVLSPVRSPVRSPIRGPTQLDDDAPAPFVGPLDGLTPLAAWSVARRLSSDYTGPLIRIRESGGDTELDIGFDADGNLDTAAAATHIGANSGFIVTVYDQAGDNDLTQATAAVQPAFNASGISSLPSASFNATTSKRWMSADGVAAQFSGISTPITAFTAVKWDQLASAVVFPMAWGLSSSSDADTRLLTNASSGNIRYVRRPDAAAAVDEEFAGNTDPHIHTMAYTAAGLCHAWRDDTKTIDGLSLGTGQVTFNQFEIGSVFLGGTDTDDRYLDGEIAEIILLGAMADTPRDALRADMTTYYSTA